MNRSRAIYITQQISQDIKEELLRGIRGYKGGYTWWFSLSKHQQSRFLQSIQRIVRDRVFNDEFKHAVFKAILNKGGTPRDDSKVLYQWMKGKVYAHRTERMYRDWYRIAMVHQDQWDISPTMKREVDA